MHRNKPLFTNTAKRKMKAGKKTVGAWCQLCSPAVAEIMAQTLYDRGYQMIMVIADGVALAKLAAENVLAFRNAYPE